MKHNTYIYCNKKIFIKFSKSYLPQRAYNKKTQERLKKKLVLSKEYFYIYTNSKWEEDKMRLRILEAPQNSGKVKATIHQSGKLGFSQAAIDELQISNDVYIMLAKNEDEVNDNNLYMITSKEQKGNGLKVSKAGDYYYVNTTHLFDKLGIDYKRKKVIFDIVQIEYEGQKIYKLIRREVDRKKSK